MRDSRRELDSTRGGWPMLGAFVESALDERLVLTFALSDVLPADRIRTVVLGVDALRDDAGHRVTVYTRFEVRRVTAYTRRGAVEHRHDEAEVSYPTGAVCVTLRVPRLRLDAQPDARGFTVIDGVTQQYHAPVTLLAA